ncbi:histidine-type phosphatase [Aeromicrobium sp.]|uniref:histidine-type phosphatase n=1 Tax=Aeromicrobium sp. TaxID=1871063 RepID=UPI003D6BECB9
MKHVKSWQACALAVVTLAALTSGATAAESDPEHDYANQTPYGTPEESVKTPPNGYTMFFLETVGRHGARSMTSDNRETEALQLWKRAATQGELTRLGETFARDVGRFQNAEEEIGYGKLSGVGREEWQGIGRRNAETYADFFASLDRRDETIVTNTTEVTRTKQSAEAMHQGLRKAGLTLDTELVPLAEAEDVLHIRSEASSTGENMTEEILDRDSIRGHAEHLLRALYSREFVDRLDDPVADALNIYKLYSTAPGMANETDITFARYVPEEDREPLSYATDVETFYQYGPGVEGETDTFDSARPLLADFFKALDDRIAGSSTAAVLRFAHGETTMPFASLINAPGSTEQVAEGERFTRGTNPWRGAKAGRLAGHIEWTAFRNAEKDVLVTMRYNEKPVQFNESCTPYAEASYFYTVDELKRCLG